VYQRALVTTDGSELSLVVFPHVRHVVDPAGTIIVVEVVDTVARLLARTTPAGFEYGTSAGFKSQMIEQMVESQRTAATEHLERAQAALTQASDTLAHDGFRNVETLILSGLPGDAIVQAAKERDCDIVLMATHGRSGLRRAVIGSVADHVLRHLDGIPILLVRPSEG